MRLPVPRIVRGTVFGAGLALATALAAVTAGSVSAAPAEGQILGDPASAVADSYVVVFRSSIAATGVDSAAQSLGRQFGGRVGHRFSKALRGFEVTMTEARAKRLAAHPAVEYVHRNTTVQASDTQLNPPSWGLDRIDQRSLPLNNSYTYPNTASTVHAYIIDTGVRFSHQDFGGRATSGRDTVDNDNDSSDCNGHGTHVAGTVGGGAFGVAKGVRLVGVRVLNCAGSGTLAGVIAGVDWVTANAVRPAVANMSLGGGANASIDAAVRNSINSGITYAVAAGNNNGANACNSSPARTAEAITVGSSTITDARSSFSNIGTCVDLFAPGTSITSAWFNSDTATNTISGTSMATPHVAGAAALALAANGSLTPAQVRDQLVNTATNNVLTGVGTGSPNKLLFVGDGGSEPPPPPPGDCTGTNGTNVNIPDAGTAVFSNITISGCTRAPSATSQVEVHIVHTWRGDLVIDLVAPDGSIYPLKSSNSSDSADNVDATYTANVAGEAANGAWRLRVRDVFRFDIGFVDTWTLRL